MKIRIIAVGKLKERFWKDACAEYSKRLGAYSTFEIKELTDIDPGKAGGINQARSKEGAAILAAIPKDSHVILLAIEGKERSSEQFSKHMDQLMLTGKSDISFIIGGSYGSSPEVYDRANELLSFGPITMPHNLARVVLVEQVYRSFKISRGEPYHK